MAKPLYMICCESGTEDAYTGMASHFNIVDRIVVMPDKPDPLSGGAGPPVTSIPLRIVSVWRAEEGDYEDEFEHEITMTLFSQPGTATLYSQPFRFLRDRPRHRTTVVIAGFKAEQSGELVVESRIRLPGQSDWLTQSYTIDVLLRQSEEIQSPTHGDASIQ
jgi:hypothetical protein